MPPEDCGGKLSILPTGRQDIGAGNRGPVSVLRRDREAIQSQSEFQSISF